MPEYSLYGDAGHLSLIPCLKVKSSEADVRIGGLWNSDSECRGSNAVAQLVLPEHVKDSNGGTIFTLRSDACLIFIHEQSAHSDEVVIRKSQ